MRTVKNNEPKRIRLTQADLDKIAAICDSYKLFDYSKIVFYEPFAETGARFTGYVEGGHSPFIKSFKFPEVRR